MRLKQLIEERNPNKIALNYSKNFNIADGLDKTDYEELVKNQIEKTNGKRVSTKNLKEFVLRAEEPKKGFSIKEFLFISKKQHKEMLEEIKGRSSDFNNYFNDLVKISNLQNS